MSFVEYTEPIWRGLNMRALKVDEAYLILKSYAHENLHLYTLSDECYRCSFKKFSIVPPISQQDNITVKLNVARPMSLQLVSQSSHNRTVLCEKYLNEMQEFGVYNFTYDAAGNCEFATDKPGVNIYLSVVTVFIILLIIIVLLKLATCAWKSMLCSQRGNLQVSADVAAAAPMTDRSPSTQSTASLGLGINTNVEHKEGQVAVVASKRVRSLDAFRGMAIVLMIFVNSGGGDYWWIEHATWNGLHVADLVFPSFLWIMGVCIPISMKSLLARGTPKFTICKRIFVRSLKLFLIGLCLNSMLGPQLANLRIMGVLQRFGIAYLICGIVHVYSAKSQYTLPQHRFNFIADVIFFKNEFLVMLGLIIIHLAIVFYLPVPNCPSGYFGPGGLHANASYSQCTGGATGYIDRQILGNAHIYQHSTAKRVYGGQPFDPEGVFGCLLTIAQVFFGMLAGIIILTYEEWHKRVLRWMLWSIGLGLLGGVLCLFAREDGFIPVNKNLWSLSYVFVTTALAFGILTIFYILVDVRELWSGTPFVESGKNAILMYVGHSIMHKMLPWHWRIGEMNTHFILLLESIWNTGLWICIALYLDAKRIYYNV